MLDVIHDAGFKPVPDEVRLTVTGTVERQGETLVLTLDRMKTPTQLAIVAHASAPEAAAHLAQHVGQVVEVQGYWQANGAGKLAVTGIKVAGEPDGRNAG